MPNGQSLSPLGGYPLALSLLIFPLLASVWLASVLRAAEEADLPPGYEAAPIAGGRVKLKSAPAKAAKDASALGIGAEAVPAFKELLEKFTGDRADEKPKEKVDPRLLNLEKQFRPQFQKLFKAERYRVHLVCGLSPEKRRLLARESEHLLSEIVRTYCLAENQRRRGGLRQKAGLDPRQLIRDRMTRLVREELGPKEAGRYFDANRLCRDRRKRVTVINLVAHLDWQLMLSAEQRHRLTESLTAHWQDAWGQSLPLFVYRAQFLPRIPDSVVLPLLDETQKTVWRGMSKQTSQVFLGNLAFGQKFGVVEE